MNLRESIAPVALTGTLALLFSIVPLPYWLAIVRPAFAELRSRSITVRLRIGSMPAENSSRKSTGVSTRNVFAT